MAENEKVEQAAQAKKDKKPEKNSKPGFFSRIGKWFKDMKSELKKVQWQQYPDRHRLRGHCGDLHLDL